MVAVGGKPAYSVVFIHYIEIVVVGRVERHADVLGFEKRLGGLVVAGHEYVEASDALVALGGKVECGAVGKHERPVDVNIVAEHFKTLEWNGTRPLAAYHLGGIEIPTAIGKLGEHAIVLQLIEIDD